MYKKDCYHCIYIRPYKKNFCVVLKEQITQINNFCCNNFRIDIIMERLEEIIDNKDDESSKRYILFNYSLRPIFI